MFRKVILILLAVMQMLIMKTGFTVAETTDELNQISLSDETVTTFGRTYYTEDGLHMNWTNSGFSFTFTGTTVKLNLTATTTFNQPFLRVFVDGVALEKDFALMTKTYTVPVVTGLEDKAHTVKVVKRTENGWGGMVTVHNIQLDGTIAQPPASPIRQIEVIGDSISCGYGNLADKRVVDNYQSNRQDGTKTFATLAAEQFGAQCNVIAKSGMGFGCNNGGSKEDTMQHAYAYTDYYSLDKETLWDFESNPSDVVIIALGTNDTSNADSTDYYNKAKSMLALVREKNPNAYIIWAYEIMTPSRSDVLQKVCREAKEAGDQKVYYHALGMMDTATDGAGDAGHPSMATHEKDSVALANLIAQITGWKRGTDGTEKTVYGDVNGDGSVDAKDALLILQGAVGKVQLNGEQITAADVNGDRAIDAKDALLVLQFAVQKIDKFPVE